MKKYLLFLLFITTLILPGCNKMQDASNISNNSNNISDLQDAITYGNTTIKFNKIEATILKGSSSDSKTIELTKALKNEIISLLNDNLTNEKVADPFKNEPTIGVSLTLSNNDETTYISFIPENKINGKYYAAINTPKGSDYIFIKTNLYETLLDLLK